MKLISCRFFFPGSVYEVHLSIVSRVYSHLYLHFKENCGIFPDSLIFQYFLMTAHPEWFLDHIFELFQYPGRLTMLGLVIRLASHRHHQQQHDS